MALGINYKNQPQPAQQPGMFYPGTAGGSTSPYTPQASATPLYQPNRPDPAKAGGATAAAPLPLGSTALAKLFASGGTGPPGYLKSLQAMNGPILGAPVPGGAPAAAAAPAGGLDLQSIIRQLQGQEDQNNAANEARYSELKGDVGADKTERLGALNGVYNEMFGLANGQSDAALQREGRQTQSELGKMQQSTINRGIGNTTVVDSLRRGIMDDSALRQNEIQDAKANKLIGLKGNYVNQLLDAIGQTNQNLQGVVERRTDQGPDLSAYAQLLAQAGALNGQGGGAGGFGGGGGVPAGQGFNMQAVLNQAANGMPHTTTTMQGQYGGQTFRTPAAQNSGSIYGLDAATANARQGFESQAPRYPSSYSNNQANILSGYNGSAPGTVPPGARAQTTSPFTFGQTAAPQPDWSQYLDILQNGANAAAQPDWSSYLL